MPVVGRKRLPSWVSEELPIGPSESSADKYPEDCLVPSARLVIPTGSASVLRDSGIKRSSSEVVGSGLGTHWPDSSKSAKLSAAVGLEELEERLRAEIRRQSQVSSEAIEFLRRDLSALASEMTHWVSTGSQERSELVQSVARRCHHLEETLEGKMMALSQSLQEERAAVPSVSRPRALSASDEDGDVVNIDDMCDRTSEGTIANCLDIGLEGVPMGFSCLHQRLDRPSVAAALRRSRQTASAGTLTVASASALAPSEPLAPSSDEKEEREPSRVSELDALSQKSDISRSSRCWLENDEWDEDIDMPLMATKLQTAGQSASAHGQEPCAMPVGAAISLKADSPAVRREGPSKAAGRRPAQLARGSRRSLCVRTLATPLPSAPVLRSGFARTRVEACPGLYRCEAL